MQVQAYTGRCTTSAPQVRLKENHKCTTSIPQAVAHLWSTCGALVVHLWGAVVAQLWGTCGALLGCRGRLWGTCGALVGHLRMLGGARIGPGPALDHLWRTCGALLVHFCGALVVNLWRALWCTCGTLVVHVRLWWNSIDYHESMKKTYHNLCGMG